MALLEHRRRPEVEDERARRIVEWTDVAFYVACRVYVLIVLGMGIVYGGPHASTLIR